MSTSIDDLFDLMSNNKKISVSLEVKQPKINNIEDCNKCCSENVVNDGREIICRDCGNVISELLDYNAEWRYYGFEDSKYSDPTRCGLPTNELLPESSLGSTISFKCGESYEMKKIRNYHVWNAMPYRERSLYNVFDGINIRAINNGIPHCIIEEAKNLYKKISEIQIHRGSNRSGIIASCIYKACILQGCPRSAKEIADIFKLNITHMTKGCKKFDEIMNTNSIQCNSNKCTKSIDFIHRFCSKLNLGKNIVDICEHVCEKAEEYNLVSKCIPPSIAAGSIFLVCNFLNINVTKKEISTICIISEVTISKCFKELIKYHKYLFPKYILDKLYI